MKTQSFKFAPVVFALAVAGLATLAARAQTTLHPPIVTISTPDPNAGEAGPNPGTFVVQRRLDFNTPPPDTSLLVFYQISGTASNGVDYQALSGSVTIPPLALGAAITVTPVDDALVEGNETVVVQLVPSPILGPIEPYRIGYPSNAVVIIADNDQNTDTNRPPFVRIAVPAPGETFTEPADIAIFAEAHDADGIVTTVEFFEGTNSLGVATNNPMSASPINPFHVFWTNVPAGYYTLRAKATDDKGAMSVSDPVPVVVRPPFAQAVVNIVASDPEGSEIPEVPPGLGMPQLIDPAVFTVWRAGGDLSQAMDVFYRVGGTAQNGVDYAELSGRVTIPAGELRAPIEVEVIDDLLVEGHETVVLTLEPPVCIAIYPPPPNCYVVGPSNQAVAIIKDNDTDRTNLPPAVRIVRPVNGDTFRAPADIPIVVDTVDADGYVSHVVFYANNMKIGEQTINFLIPPPPGQHIEFDMVWSNVPPGRYTLTAKGTDDQGAMSFAAPVAISVVETNPPPTNALPIVTIVATDGFASEGVICYSNIFLGSTTWSTAIGWDPTMPTRTNAFCVTNRAAFKVRRHGSTNDDLRVFYALSGTASNGVDYETLPGVVTIPAGRRAAEIVVVPVDDALPEKIETVVVALVQPPFDSLPTYDIGWPRRACAIIVDNDLPRPPCLRLADGHFHLCRPATNGFCHRIEWSTDLINWTPYCTNIVNDGAVHFVDPESDPLRKFYRAVPEATPPED
jgi:hypothetical protein